MPHDKNGKLIEVGTRVLIPCVVKSVTADEEYCNMTVETEEGMAPHGDKSTYTLNTKQALIVE